MHIVVVCMYIYVCTNCMYFCVACIHACVCMCVCVCVCVCAVAFNNQSYVTIQAVHLQVVLNVHLIFVVF